MTDDYTIRVDAGDLADIIADRQSARADYETCVRDATEAATQWREEISELLGQFNSFRRAVQEATGLDQPELLHDDELINRVAHAALRSHTRVLTLRDASVEIDSVFTGHRDVSWTPPQYADFQRTGFAQQHDVDETASAGPVEVEDNGPPTESMPAVEEPPETPAGYQIGRVFTRGDTYTVRDAPDLVINRLGDVMRVFADDESGGDIVLRQDGSRVTWAEQLHMNGTLWEILSTSERPSVAEQALVDDEAVHSE